MSAEGKKHGGHRDRLRDRFINDGLDSFEEHNILEMLLFYTIPQKDTNELAHSLLDKFGSLEGVFSASPDHLMQVEGIGEHSARFLSLFSVLIDSYITDRRQNDIICGIDNITEFVIRKLAFLSTESLMILFIDNKQSLISWNLLQEGTVSPDKIDNKELLRMVMGTNVMYIMLARNNLKGKAKLSNKDNGIALIVSEALRTVGVTLYDYIAVGRDGSYVTMFDRAGINHKKNSRHKKAGDFR